MQPAIPTTAYCGCKKGSLEFDPDYYVDLNKISDSPAVYFTWQVRDRSLFAAVWDKADDPKELKDPDEAYRRSSASNDLYWPDAARARIQPESTSVTE